LFSAGRAAIFRRVWENHGWGLNFAGGLPCLDLTSLKVRGGGDFNVLRTYFRPLWRANLCFHCPRHRHKSHTTGGLGILSNQIARCPLYGHGRLFLSTGDTTLRFTISIEQDN
jgi:hypothetical protein